MMDEFFGLSVHLHNGKEKEIIHFLKVKVILNSPHCLLVVTYIP